MQQLESRHTIELRLYDVHALTHARLTQDAKNNHILIEARKMRVQVDKRSGTKFVASVDGLHKNPTVIFKHYL